MPYVSNNLYLELAVADFRHCQEIHQLELLGLKRWLEESWLEKYSVTEKSLTRAYFLAAASIFEPRRSGERLGWARTAVLAESIASFFRCCPCSSEAPRNFLEVCRWGRKRRFEGLVEPVIDLLAGAPEWRRRMRMPAQRFRQGLRRAWEEWATRWAEVEEDHGRLVSAEGATAVLLVRTVELCAGRIEPKTGLARLEFDRLAGLLDSICGRLQSCALEGSIIEKMIELEMQELVKCVLESSSKGLNRETKQTFLAIAKSYYYTAYCPIETLNNHISKVLFEPVDQ
ncbi:Ent-copalyl diphosphate synthase 2 [Apostasia shenzhenica]|uniref:Ent-copalyl diphosphate synthase 2 n=1 Tax=Apostasia shenzhenica TaxID=1088818 RepID=A0A2I0ADH3_9ASPA|nr:Ent-copalyl diphosphate synthase 2 [Apostasia shenzhenica]